MPLGIAILTFFALAGFLLSYPGTLLGDLFVWYYWLRSSLFINILS